ITGPGIWRGGYNSGKEGSINHLFVDTECGINRVSVRSTLTPGAVTLKAIRAGLKPATLQLNSAPIAMADGIMRAVPAVFAKELPGPCPVDAAALARQIEHRLASAPVLGKSQRSNTLFSTFNYTGEGTGGGEVEAAPEALAYSDDALLYLRKVPSLLRGARLIRTASKDNTYWANDYIVATTACPLTLFVAHDPRAPKPSWLGAYQPTSEDVMVNTQRLQLYALKLAKDAIVRIPGNTDQGEANGSALNLILFAAPAKPDPSVSQN
ncbi:MAG: glycoside hydrolase family 2 protein, partial [Verrucomicrobiota bacterium]